MPMDQKVLLLFPNSSNEGYMPIAIGILSTFAKQCGFKVDYFETSFYQKPSSAGEERERTGEFKFVNRKNFLKLLPYNYLQRDFNRKLLTFKPDIIAVSANSLEYELFCDFFKKIPKLKPKPVVIIGGVHATVAPEEVIKNPQIDVLCIGEGEKAWKEFLHKFKKRKDFSSVKNLWVKQGNKIKKNPLRPLLDGKELWNTPLDYSFFDKKHFLSPFDGKMYHRGQVELSRGCPYNCTYCVNSGFKNIYQGLGRFMRVRPLANLKKAIKKQVDLGTQMLQLQDENFLAVPMNKLKIFCQWYGSKIKLPLMIQGRPELVTEDKIKLIASMGIPVQLSLGVESGSERILHNICHRYMTLEQIKNAFKIIRKYKIRSTAYTMVGFPTETRQEVFATINLIRACKVDISIMSVFYPFKGTPLREYCLKNGYMTGKEKTKTFTDKSVLKNQPMTAGEISNLRRTYALYTRLPRKYFSRIKRCEQDYNKYKNLFNKLVLLLNKKYYKSWNLNK